MVSSTTSEKISGALLRSSEPSIRWKVRVLVEGKERSSPAVRALEREIGRSARVKTLLARRDSRGLLRGIPNPYMKWQGAHWVLASLADLGYPQGDRSLFGMRDQILNRWLAPVYDHEFDAVTESQAYRGRGVPRIRGRYRRCASQQGNALYFLEKLGIATSRSDHLVERLLHWQWPDGGWNCDRNPSADTSSFWETRHAMLGLALYARRTGSSKARDAAERAAEVFLTRRLFLERGSGRVMNPEFVRLHYPLYYHYDLLGGLRAMAEIGLIDDRRCQAALDLLERKRLADGGFPAEGRFYKVSSTPGSRKDSIDWGGTSKKKSNEWVSADALVVLRAAGRI
jgi:hypothetical protein